jgi:hypothetical protein
MTGHTSVQRVGSIALVAALLAAASPWRASAAELPGVADDAIVAQAGGTEPRELEPRYKPVPPPEQSSYNSDYVFGMTRGVANSTIHPAGKVLLFPLTVPLDLVFFPFALIGGFFG